MASNETSLVQAKKLIDFFRENARLEGADSVMVWHIVYTLWMWCDHNGVDIKEVIDDVRRERLYI